MANAFVQRAAAQNDFGGTTIQVSLTGVGSGNLLCIGVAWTNGAITISSVADDKSNTWTIGKSQVSGVSNNVSGYYAKNVASGNTTVTVTFSSAPSRQRLTIHEISGANTTAPLDVVAGNTQTDCGTGANAATSTAATTTADGDYIFGFVTDSNVQPTWTAGTGYTLGTSSVGTADERQVQSTAGSIAATFTSSDAFADPVTIMMSFLAAGGAAAGQPIVKRFGGVPYQAVLPKGTY